MFCPHCGRQIRDNSKFCQFCGEKIQLSSVTPAGISVNRNSNNSVNIGKVSKIPRNPQGGRVDISQTDQGAGHAAATNGKTNATPKLFAIAGIAILLLGIAGFVLFNTALGGNFKNQGKAIEWHDDAFEYAVRQFLHKPQGKIYQGDLDQVVELTCWGSSIAFREDENEIVDEEFLSYIDAGQYYINPYNNGWRKEGYKSTTIDLSGENLINSLEDYASFRNGKILTIRSASIPKIGNNTNVILLDISRYSSDEIVQNMIFDESFSLPSLKALSIDEQGQHEDELPTELQTLEHLWFDVEHSEDEFISDTNKLNISQMVNLKNLRLNLVEGDIGFLRNLSKLESLDLNCFSATGWEALPQYAPNLRALYLDGANIHNYQSLSDLTCLETLSLSSDSNLDTGSVAEVIKNCPNLSSLTLNDMDNLAENSFSPLVEAIRNMGNCKNLSLNFCNLSDLSLLSGLIQLEALDLSNNNISDITPIGTLTNLRDLFLGGNHISDISPLERLSQLVTLELYGNQLSNLSSLSNLNQLETLYLGNNGLSSINDIGQLSSLTYLDISDNNISNIEALCGLNNLKTLMAYQNDLTDISPLHELTNLVTLYLNDNNISDLTPLSELSELKILYLGGNPIEDFSPVESINYDAIWSLEMY